VSVFHGARNPAELRRRLKRKARERFGRDAVRANRDLADFSENPAGEKHCLRAPTSAVN
jgi:hypothetical protein